MKETVTITKSLLIDLVDIFISATLMVICHTFIVFEFHIVPCIHDIKTLTAFMHYIDGLVQERRNSSVLAMKLCLSCTYPLICIIWKKSIFCDDIEINNSFETS